MLEKFIHLKAGRSILLLLIALCVIGSNGQSILPDTIRSCMADSVLVTANPVYDSLIWGNGETGESTWFYESGEYSLTWYKYGLQNNHDFILIIIPAEIAESEISINCGDTVVIHGSDYTFNYLWEPFGIEGDSAGVYPRDTSFVYAVISNPDTSELYCIDSVSFNVEPIILVDTVKQKTTGCPGDSTAWIKIEASGGFSPYSYIWPPEAIPWADDPSNASGLVDGDKVIEITDTIGCILIHPFEVKAHLLPELELFTDPIDTVFLQNPFVKFSYENPTYDSLVLVVDDSLAILVNDQFWDFGDSTDVSYSENPTYAYKKSGLKSIVLTFTTARGCVGTDTIEIHVEAVKLVASAAVTPNGDTKNDFFELFEDDAGSGGSGENSSYKSGGLEPIDLSKYYLNNTLSIFNRWGEVVHKVDNYDNDWDADGMVDGTYFYVIECFGQYRTDVFKGTFMILGSGKSE